MHIGRFLSFSAILALGTCSLLAQVTPDTTITINVAGTVGPLLYGTDPLLANGGTGGLRVLVSESLSPISTTATSATYRLAPGAVTLNLNGNLFTSTSAAQMTITIPSQGPDNVILNAAFAEGTISVTVSGRASLKHGSFTSAVLVHPTPFPGPQQLTAATSPTGAGSKLTYTILGSSSSLGFSGKASDTAAADPVLPYDEADQ